MKKLQYSLICFLVCLLIVPVKVSAAPNIYSTTLKKQQVQKLENLQIGESTFLKVRTAAGKTRVKLTAKRNRHNPAQIVDGKFVRYGLTSELKLFKARKKVRKSESEANSRVGAFIVDRTLYLFFKNKRNRNVRIKSILSSTSDSKALIEYAPRRAALKCATDTSSRKVYQSQERSTEGLGITGDEIIQISTIADYEMYEEYGDGVNAYLVGLLAEALDIYNAQLGIKFQLLSQSTSTSPINQPFSSSDSNTLLNKLIGFDYDFAKNPDVVHLFVNKSLDGGSTLGLARLGDLCGEPNPSGFSLSTDVHPELTSSTFAHELGHNLNADHIEGEGLLNDGDLSLMGTEAGPPGSTYSFAQGSLDQINNFLDGNNQCLLDGEAGLEEGGSDPIKDGPIGTEISLRSFKAKGKSSKPKGKFRGIIDISGAKANCTVEVYGHYKKKFLVGDGDPAESKAKLLHSYITSGNETSIELSSTYRNGNCSTRKKYFFLAKNYCVEGGSYVLSDIKRVSAPGYGNSCSIKSLGKKIGKKLVSEGVEPPAE